MAQDNGSWFTETCTEAGTAMSWAIEEHLAHAETAYQVIDVYRTTHWGHLMAIDGFVMLTSRDNFLYHEMLAHPALFSHPNPENVVIIGGGDCGTLHEVLAHREVRSVLQCEIDEEVTRLAERYFPELCARNDDPRATLTFDDGLALIRDAEPESLDVIIVDSTDPIGPAEGLFGPDFVADCHAALRDGGILVQQSESPLIHPRLLDGIRQNMERAGFETIRTLGFPQPCYPSGWWSATQARKHGLLAPPDPERVADSGVETRYYNAEVHRGALATQIP
jgi:spermidine synthase